MTVRYLRLPEVRQMTGLSTSTIYRLEQDGAFPGRVRLGPRAVAWREDELAEWMASRAKVAA